MGDNRKENKVNTTTMSINAKYFRLGNWVETYMVLSSGSWMDKDGNWRGANKITEPTIRQKQVDIEDLSIILKSQGLATYRGIPLTPEILESVGFERNCSFFEKDSVQIMWGYTKEEGDFFHYTVDELVQYPCFKHLHQLQNLYFALTQKELEYSPVKK